jgi:hypothetical protein
MLAPMPIDVSSMQRDAKGRLTAVPKGAGRAKGTPNKAPRLIREMIHRALEELGGVKYLVEQGRTEPRAFLALLRAVIPKQIEAEVGSSLEALLAKSFEQPKAISQPAERDVLDQELHPEEDAIIDIPAQERDPCPKTPTTSPETSSP